MKNRWWWWAPDNSSRLHDFICFHVTEWGLIDLEIMHQLLFPFCVSLPADGRLAVRWPLGRAERLAHLSLCQAQGQPADLKCFGEFTNLLQVDPIHLAGGGLRVYNTTNKSHFISPLLLCRLPHFPEWMKQTSSHMRSWSSPNNSKNIYALGQNLLFLFALVL